MDKFLKILLVHNQENVVNSVRAHFNGEGCMIRVCKDGLEALMQARIDRFDLLICGLDLPIITGVELVRSLRNLSFNKISTVIFLGNDCEASLYHDIAVKLDSSIMTVQELIDTRVGQESENDLGAYPIIESALLEYKTKYYVR